MNIVQGERKAKNQVRKPDTSSRIFGERYVGQLGLKQTCVSGSCTYFKECNVQILWNKTFAGSPVERMDGYD